MEKSTICQIILIIRSPLAPNVPFFGESLTAKTYQPFKIEKLANIKPKEVKFSDLSELFRK